VLLVIEAASVGDTEDVASSLFFLCSITESPFGAPQPTCVAVSRNGSIIFACNGMQDEVAWRCVCLFGALAGTVTVTNVQPANVQANMLLEHPTGPYDVGATTFTLPVRPTEVIGKAAVRTETGQTMPALRLEEVSFTAYYPASPTKEQSRGPTWLNWLPRYVLYKFFGGANLISN
jgi:hypothetical protein